MKTFYALCCVANIVLNTPVIFAQQQEHQEGEKDTLTSANFSVEKSYDSTTIYTIPVVVHILHEYGYENISDAQVFDAINILNKDFAKLNADTIDIIPQYIPYAANVKIQFKLASLDPNGNYTNGIEHIYSHLTNSADEGSKINAWPQSSYFNIWVVKSIGESGVVGYTLYPNQVDSIGICKDGVVMINSYIGSIGSGNSFTSRSLTHEVGHYLGLYHLNALPTTSGCGDDNIQDTPITGNSSNCSDLYADGCSNTAFTSSMKFNDVNTTSGVFNPSIADSVFFRLNNTPFEAVGLSANSMKDSVFAFSNWEIGAVNGLTDSILLTGTIDPTKYYEITLTAGFRNVMDITSMSFAVNRSATGPRTFCVKSSIDGFLTNLNGTYNASLDTLLEMINTSNVFFYKTDTTLLQKTFKINLAIPNYLNLDFQHPVTFRIYAWNAEDAMGSFDIDSVSFFGNAGIVENAQNFMSFNYCPMMFTKGQANYMRTILQSNIANRNNLWTAQNLALTGVDVTALPLSSPKADFHSNTKFACEGTPVTFADFSWGATVDTRTWAFQGGTPSTSTATNPIVTFTGNGWHQVTLTVSNANGSDTKTINQAIFITTYNDFYGPYSETFDGQSAAWWISDNPEENETKWELVNNFGYNGTNCMELKNYKNISAAQVCDDDFYYQDQLGEGVDNLISPNFDLSNTSGISVTFKYAYASNASTSTDITEALKVYISKDCGKTWQYRKGFTGTDLLTTGIGLGDYVPSSQAEWKTGSATITTSSVDKNVCIKFEFTASDYSNNLYIDDVNITGVLGIPNNPLIDMGVNVYPNPVSTGSQLTVAYTANGNPMSIELIDMTGRIVYKGENKQTTGEVVQTINVASTLAPGVYSFRISDGNYFLDKKVVIQ